MESMKKQLTELEKKIVAYNDSYRKGVPEISDKDYDLLKERLQKDQPNSDLLKDGVIETTPLSRKVKLPIPMKSLEKCKELSEVFHWISSLNLSDEIWVTLTPKYDGISLSVEEESKKAYTRGDGEIGQRSDQHFSLISSPKNTLPIITFGEAIMKKSIFEEKYKGQYKSARNLVAGLFNSSKFSDKLVDVDYIRYGIADSNLSKDDQINVLNRLNREPVLFATFRVKELSNSLLDKFYKHWSAEYNIDGIVIDINYENIRKDVGYELNGNPKYARAFKSPLWSMDYTTTVIDIEINVSKQGKLKPVILVFPVDIDGVIVSRVTGYNAKYLFDKKIAIGSEIEITRSGDVIPKHLKTTAYYEENVHDLMDNMIICPDCDEPVKWDESFTELICVNENCVGIKLSKMEHFFSTLEIEDFSRASIESLFNNDYKTVSSILNITEEQLCQIEGWAVISAKKLLKQFDKLRLVGIPFAKLLHAMDLFGGGIGEKTIQLIIDNTKSIDNTTVKELILIKGVAEKTAIAFNKGMDSFNSYKELPIKIAYYQTPKKEPLGKSCEGWKVCFTGIRSKEVEDAIKEEGGEIVSGVSKKTTHLIVKDLSQETLSSAKAVKAKELGIEIIEINNLLN